MPVPENIRKKLAESTGKGGGAFLNYGRYVLMLKKWFWNQGYEGLSDIHEFVVMSAEKLTVQEGDKTVSREPNPVGSTASHVVAYFGNSKPMAEDKSAEFMFGFTGLKPEETTSDARLAIYDEFMCDAQPGRGMLVACEVYPKEKRKTPGEWMAIPKFSCYAKPGAPGENSIEEAAKRWAAYEAKIRAGAAA